MQRDAPDGSQTSAGSWWQGLAVRWGGLVPEAASHRGFSGCVQPPPFRPRWVWELPWMEWNWSLLLGEVRAGGSALSPLEALEEVRQWTLQMVLGIAAHPSQRSSGCCHCLLTQEHIYSAWREERAAKATSGHLQCCNGTQKSSSPRARGRAQLWGLMYSRTSIIRSSGARQRRVEPEQLLSTPDTTWSPP